MKKKFVAFLRQENSLRELAISDAGKPAVDQTFTTRWQSVIDLIAEEAEEPVAQLLRVTQDSISNMIPSDSKDHNDIKGFLRNGLYCESELGKTGLLITSQADGDADDDDQPSMPSLVACFGLPILWPDEALFGVICVLNSAGKFLKPSYRNILAGLKETIEQELILLLRHQQTPQVSDKDALTGIYSRTKIEEFLKHEFDRAKRYLKTFSITIIDLSAMQLENEAVVNATGDALLKAFAKSIGSKIRETDFWGRWSAEAFILVCPYADTVETQQMFARIRPSVNSDMKAKPDYTDFYFGVSQYEPDDLTYQAIVKRAEENMRQYKEMMKRKAAAMEAVQSARAE